jgi:holin-like protein
MIFALSILILCQLVGDILMRLIGAPIPGPVAGLALMFLMLCAWSGLDEKMRQTARGLLTHLSLLFVPAGTGVMLHLARLESEFVPVIASLVISTTLSLVVTALVFGYVARRVPPMGGET